MNNLILLQGRHKGVKCFKCGLVIETLKAIALRRWTKNCHTKYYHIQCWEVLFQ